VPKVLSYHRSLIALVLIVWCAGTGCMIVSYAHAGMTAATEMQSAPAPGQSLSGAVSGSMGMHACCKAQHASSKQDHHAPVQLDQDLAPGVEEIALPGLPTESDVMSCCPLTSGSIVISTRTQTNDNASALTQDALTDFALTPSTPAPLAVPLRLPNRSQSYLLDCSFLI
jgi:hypothetical protein